MITIGIRRRLDKLGRIVIPKELRNQYGIENNDELEIIGTDQGILLRVPNVIITVKKKEQ